MLRNRRLPAVLALLAILLPGSAAQADSGGNAGLAVTDPVFIQQAFSKLCLDQHYAPNATTTIYSWPCHEASYRPGNQQWRFTPVPGTSYWRLINKRSNWCLSQPNVGFSQIYAEVCDAWLPPKQLWLQAAAPARNGFLINAYTGKCLEERYRVGDGYGDVFGETCPTVATPRDPTVEWRWNVVPS